MRPAERDLLLLLLAAGSGAADAWSYLGLGHTFVANMTGNTVLLGLAAFGSSGEFLHPLIALACYAAGTAVSSAVNRRMRSGALWSPSISWTLLVESLLLAAVEIAWFAYRVRNESLADSTDLLLAAAAFAIGLQSGAMLELRIPGIVTTYITGTWTTLISGAVGFVGGGKTAKPRQRLQFEERRLMQAGILTVYFMSAVLTGFLFRRRPAQVGVLPAASIFAAAVYGLLRGGIHRE